MGLGVQKALFCFFRLLRYSNCWWVKCGEVGQAEIACFYLFRNVRLSSRFPCATPGVERFSLDLS